jgi:hypothetical protein
MKRPSLRDKPIEVQVLRKVTNLVEGKLWNVPKIIKETPKDDN